MTANCISIAHNVEAGIRDAATFWHGPSLSKLDLACLLSFAGQGFDVTIYSYSALAGLPLGIKNRDASEILSKDYLTSFTVMGKPSLSHFSDLFRYALFDITDSFWIDTDLLCLQNFIVPRQGNFLTRETESRLNGAILRIDPTQDALKDLLRETRSFAKSPNFRWGATGPTLITRYFGSNALKQAAEPERFYPVHWDDWWMPFLPSEFDRCELACHCASALHLWNNIVTRAGYWKDLAPPKGSFLHEKLVEQDLISLFKDALPSENMIQLVENYQSARNGAHMRVSDMLSIVARRLVSKRLT